ncbi:MAG TPA: CoA-acylating methylmalonate-semialdehyde dehydrogenase [Steroidobacter sp.]|uniref:CoA-acylating methylmalonate-semialdehyde dehydrogenase n=1 Tax=Steroidobacter sp. TaxID=1978227 RepID=UPI002EDADBEC
MREVHHYVSGATSRGRTTRFADVYNPNTGEVSGRVNLAGRDDVIAAIEDAARAFPAWADTPPPRRAHVMFRFRELIRANLDELAHMLASEHGKVIADAKGELQRGLDLVEFACGIPHLLKGEYSENVAAALDVYSMRQPLGVVAGITPFNFPAMVPMWMFVIAIACGNTFVLKPSEKDPSVPQRLAELMLEAGLPKGVFNVVNGDKEAVDAILTHPLVQAVSFVGSTDIARYVYSVGSAHGKRVQAMGGAKNHMIIMPDADLDQVADALIGAGYGSAGERCMAISVAVPVGAETADALRERLTPRVQALRVGLSTSSDADFGPMISRAHLEKVKGYVERGIQEGAELVVDGRKLQIPSYEDGFFMGGCLFDRVTAKMRIYQEEIFGPVLSIVRVDNFDAALKLPSEHAYGNGVSIFTRDGDTAREFTRRVNVGMVGVNVPIPVPVAFHSFGGWKNSAFGDTNQHGAEGVRFFTKVKTVTARWPTGIRKGADFFMPTLK